VLELHTNSHTDTGELVLCFPYSYWERLTSSWKFDFRHVCHGGKSAVRMAITAASDSIGYKRISISVEMPSFRIYTPCSQFSVDGSPLSLSLNMISPQRLLTPTSRSNTRLANGSPTPNVMLLQILSPWRLLLFMPQK